MDKSRRKILAGITAGVSGLAMNKHAAALTSDSCKRDRYDSEKVQSQGHATTKADIQIKHDLAFPRQHLRSSYKDRLQLIEKYMLDASLSEEHYCKGPVISELENKVATLFGKPAAMWCTTGTLAQGIAARVHGEKTGRKFLQLHPTSHLVLHEDDGYKYAHGFESIISGAWRQPLKAELIEKSAACMIVEMPQRHSGGILPEWSELEALKRRAKDLNVPLHMDGARVWSARTFYGHRTYADIADGFSSIYVSFYKDIGACGGAALIGDKQFIEKARVWRSRLGGVVSEHWPVVCDALRQIDTKLVQIDNNVALARKYASFINKTTCYATYPKTPHSNLFHVLLPCTSAAAKAAHIEAAKATGVWLTNTFWNYENKDSCAMEITISESAAAVPNETLEKAFLAFFYRI